MQILVEWNNYKIQKYSQTAIANNVMIKTGIVTMLSVLVVSLNVILDTNYPIDFKNENYYLYKDFISSVCTFVLVPIAIILRNQTISENCKKQILSARVYIIFKENVSSVKSNAATLQHYFNNTIHPA